MSKKAQQAAWNWAIKNKLDPYSMGRAFGEGYDQGCEELKAELKTEIDKQIAFYENSCPGKSEYCKGSDAGALEVLRWFKERL